MKYSHYFKSGKTHQILVSNKPSFDPYSCATHVFDSAKAAKAWAKSKNLTPWNY